MFSFSHLPKLISFCLVILFLNAGNVVAQVPPSPEEHAAYTGLHAAASKGDVSEIQRLISSGADMEYRDRRGRTALHVAAFQSHDNAVNALVKAGSGINTLENDSYDVITIAAVADDPDMVRLALKIGGNPANVTSRYEGTALIAAAHLGHVEVVQILIDAGAPLDHVNNLTWTALIEAVVLGDGGPRHVATARALIRAGADVSIGDEDGITPLDHAKRRGYTDMIKVFDKR